MPREPEPTRLKDLLKDFAPKLGTGAVESGVIWARWTQIVGPQIAAQAEPTSLRQGVLRVRASSPTWATEIGYLAEQIRAEANSVAGREVVQEVKVWTGPGPIGRSAGAPRPAGAGRADEAPRRTSRDDPLEALEAARAAQRARRSRGGSGGRSGAGETPPR